jgi:hypothetical protein
MTNPAENAPWWNLLLEIVALPAVNAALPFVLAAILAFALLGVGRVRSKACRRSTGLVAASGTRVLGRG